METLSLDLKYAVRSLLKRPSFPIVVLATIALGIGAATAIFSIVEAILLRPLPFEEPDRLVFASETDGEAPMSFAWPNYVDYRARATSFEHIACHQGNAFNVIGNETAARRINGRLVCAQFFDVLQACIDGLPASLARIFMMREWLDYETAQICKELSITPTNCFVMLYRARMRLRECLEVNWFGTADG